MSKQRIYNRYTPAYVPQSTAEKPQRWFIFQKDRLLTRSTGASPELPDHSVLEHFAGNRDIRHYLGDFDQNDYYCMSLDETAELPDGFEFNNLRSLNGQVDAELFMLAGRAYQILHWDRLSRFCGRCGAPTRMKDDERAKQCDACGNVIYPRISPAIIIAIIKDDQILLAHNRNFRSSMYSVIAGFMEPGEEFEDTAEREVYEEVGIRIKNLRYFGSQSWPFPDSLMVGFTGEFAGGEIQADGQEIEHAAWFDRDHLPEIPNTTSIAGRLIRWFVEKA